MVIIITQRLWLQKTDLSQNTMSQALDIQATLLFPIGMRVALQSTNGKIAYREDWGLHLKQNILASISTYPFVRACVPSADVQSELPKITL